MICNDPVDLFRHTTVKTPQPGLDMADRDVEFGSRERAGKDRVSIALDKDDVRGLFQPDRFNTGHDFAGLFRVAAGPDIEIMTGLGEFEVPEKDPVHLVGIVLAGVQYRELRAGVPAGADDRRHLDNFGAGAKNNGDHGFVPARNFNTVG